MKAQTLICLAGIATAPAALLYAIMIATSPPPSMWQLVLERNGVSHVLDTDQTFDDCQGAASIATAVSTSIEDIIYCERTE